MKRYPSKKKGKCTTPGPSNGIDMVIDDRWYESNCCVERRWDIDRRGIELGRIVDLNLLSEENNLLVVKMLEKVNLRGLVDFTIDEQKLYQEEVRQFYCFLEEVECGSCRSYVNGRVLHFNGVSLEKALRVGGRGKVSRREYSKADALRLLRITKLKSKELDVDMRILHSIMTYNILPVSGHRDVISEEQLQLLYYIHEGIRPNIGEFILRTMVNATRNKQKNLPYGMLLTRLLIYHEVPLEGREWHSSRLPVFNGNTLALMGIFRDPQNAGNWIVKNRRERFLGTVNTAKGNDGDDEDNEVNMGDADGVEMNAAESLYDLSVQFNYLRDEFCGIRDETMQWEKEMGENLQGLKISSARELVALRFEVGGLKDGFHGVRAEQQRTNDLLGKLLEEVRKK